MKENKDFNKHQQQKNPTWPQKPQYNPGAKPGCDQGHNKKGHNDHTRNGGCGC